MKVIMIKNYNNAVSNWKKVIRICKEAIEKPKKYIYDPDTTGILVRRSQRTVIEYCGGGGYCKQFQKRLQDKPCDMCPLQKSNLCYYLFNKDVLFWKIYKGFVDGYYQGCIDWKKQLSLAQRMLQEVKKYKDEFKEKISLYKRKNNNE